MANITRKIIRELILTEVEDLFSQGGATTADLYDDSVDDQVDAFILKFEKDSVLSSEEAEDALAESLKKLSLSALISEQDEDLGDPDAEEDVDIDTGPPPAEAASEDPAPGDPPAAGSENMKPDTVPAVDIPRLPLDIDAFTKRIARLAMNYETLLNVKKTIVNRAASFLLEHYDKGHADEMKEILDRDYDFELSNKDNTPQDNFAVGAWAGGTGGGGGG